MKSLAKGTLLCAAGLLCGCAPHKYQPAPIAPAATAAALYERSLDDPNLNAWMQRNGSSPVTPWPRQTWDLNALILAAFYFNPDLDTARATVVTAEAAITTAAAKPNPSVSVGPGYEGPAGSQFITAFDFSLPIETAGKRGYRTANATHLSAASRLQLGQVAWAVRSRLRAALVDYLFALDSAELLRKEVDLRERYVHLTEARLDAGEVSLPDVTAARIDLASLRQTWRTAEGLVRTTHTAVASAIGVPDASLAEKTLVWEGADHLPEPDSLPSFRVRKLAVSNRLDVARALEQYEAAQSALQLEVARQYPDLNLAPAYSFEEGSNFISLSLSSVLPLRNHNEGPIGEAEAQRKAAGAQLLAVQSAVLADVDRSWAQYTAAFSSVASAASTVRETEAQGRSAAQLLQAGEADQLTSVAAQLQTSVAERARLDAAHQAQLALGLLEDALQHPLQPSDTPALPQIAPRP